MGDLTIDLIICCPHTWTPAKKLCSAFGVPSVHGCGKTPDHDGDHCCPCGSKHPADHEQGEFSCAN